MLRLISFCFALAMAFGGSAAAQSGRADEYRIAIGDRLSISVLEDPGLNQTVLVRPDGRISLPLAGTVDARGRSPEELQAAIRRALARDFIDPPTVTVAVTGLGPEETVLARIYVIGQVASPGALDVELPLDILQALALAGGPSAFAATRRIQVRRTTNGRQSVQLFDYDQIDSGALPYVDFSMADGDVIVVPERGLFE
jgi:polysaccharide export outer membrane protein